MSIFLTPILGLDMSLYINEEIQVFQIVMDQIPVPAIK